MMDQKDNKEKRVLVVEDETGIALVCRGTLTAEGFKVDVAANGQVGLEMLRQDNYDLCISDIKTPHMNGIEMFQQLVQEYPQAIHRFIFTTGDVLSGNVKEFLDTINRPYLPKPFTPEELRNIVRKTLVIV